MKPSDTRPKSRHRFALTQERGEDKKDLVRKMRDLYNKDVQADHHNIEPAREDIQFVIGDQWDDNTKRRRDRLNKPVLTVNRLPAFVAQYLGSWQQTDTTLKFLPMQGGSKSAAEVRQGVTRNIVKGPRGKHATYTAMETAYICGVGNFGLELIDNKYDIFAKDIEMVAFDDPFQVVWDRASREPTGSDANHCFAAHWMTKDDYRKAYPKASYNDAGWGGDELDYTTMTAHGWETDEMIRLAHFWQMREETVTLGLERMTGDIIEIDDMDEQEREARLERDRDGELMVRETTRPYAECHVLNGSEIIDGPFRLNISRLPVFRIEGWALQESSVRYRWGFVRNAKDPQRLHNYQRSILAEELQKSPASKWLLDSATAKSGLADQFRNAHLSGDSVLFWDSQADGAKPEFIQPPVPNQAVLTEAQMTVQDIKDVTNKHEASLGVTSNEVSGKAISARQRVSELGDRIYLENMNLALAECAKVINELFPEVYDTHRVVKVMGNDDQILVQEINNEMDDETPDVTKGKYEITYTTGPSYATKREEASETMLTLMNHMPQTANFIADILARNMDIPGAEEIEERMMQMLPPGMIDLDRLPERKRAKLQAQIEANQQAQQENQQVQMQMMSAEFAKLQAEVQNISAQAMKSEAQAREALARVGVDLAKAESSHEIGKEKNLIDAARVGVEVDNLEADLFKIGMDMADRAGQREERDADRQQQATAPNQETE